MTPDDNNAGRWPFADPGGSVWRPTPPLPNHPQPLTDNERNRQRRWEKVRELIEEEERKEPSHAERIAALEHQVAALKCQIVDLRADLEAERRRSPNGPVSPGESLDAPPDSVEIGEGEEE